MPGEPAKISLLGFVSEYHCSREYVTWIVIRILCHCQTFPGFGDIGMVFWKILKKEHDQRPKGQAGRVWQCQGSPYGFQKELLCLWDKVHFNCCWYKSKDWCIKWIRRILKENYLLCTTLLVFGKLCWILVPRYNHKQQLGSTWPLNAYIRDG